MDEAKKKDRTEKRSRQISRIIPITPSNEPYKFYLFSCSCTKKYNVTWLCLNFLDFATKENF
jgi:hypothetical protein